MSLKFDIDDTNITSIADIVNIVNINFPYETFWIGIKWIGVYKNYLCIINEKKIHIINMETNTIKIIVIHPDINERQFTISAKLLKRPNMKCMLIYAASVKLTTGGCDIILFTNIIMDLDNPERKQINSECIYNCCMNTSIRYNPISQSNQVESFDILKHTFFIKELDGYIKYNLEGNILQTISSKWR